MIRIFHSLHSTMTGLIGTRLFFDTNVTSEKAGFCRRKVGSPIRRSTRGPRQTIIQERRNPFPSSTTFGYEDFNNGGADIRLRKLWGDGTIFKGSALTFGSVVYHGDAPFTRYTLTEETNGPDFLTASRGSTSDIIPLDQSRTADYQAILYRGSHPDWKISHGRLVPP